MTMSLMKLQDRFSTPASSIIKSCSNAIGQSQRQRKSSVSLRFSSTASTRPLPPIYYTHIPYRVPYSLGLALQEHLVSRRAVARSFIKEHSSTSTSTALDLENAERISSTDFLILQEHSPVFTDGRRATVSTSRENQGGEEETPITEEGKRLIQTGADYCLTKRGGLVTYHGPGQITGYPILDLGQMGLSTRTYIQSLEASIRDYLLSRHSLSTLPCNPNMTGVFFTPTQKVSSIGVQVRHRVSSHGFALNITDEPLNWFSKIVACGLEGVNAESLVGRLNQLRKEKTEDMILEGEITVENVMEGLIESFRKGLKREIKEAEKGIFEFEGDVKSRLLEKVWVDGEEVRG